VVEITTKQICCVISDQLCLLAWKYYPILPIGLSAKSQIGARQAINKSFSWWPPLPLLRCDLVSLKSNSLSKTPHCFCKCAYWDSNYYEFILAIGKCYGISNHLCHHLCHFFGKCEMPLMIAWWDQQLVKGVSNQGILYTILLSWPWRVWKLLFCFQNPKGRGVT